MTAECRPPEGTPGCWFCKTGRGPICDDCIDRADRELEAHFAAHPELLAEPPADG